MKLTSIRIKKTARPEDGLLGIASIQLDDCLVIHDIRLVQLKDKRIISFPNKKIKKYMYNEDGCYESFQFADLVHPSNKEFRDYIETELYRIYDAESEVDSNE